MPAPPRPNYHLTLPAVMKPGEVAKLLGITPHALQRPCWDRRLQPFRTGGGHRRYTREAVADVLSWWPR